MSILRLELAAAHGDKKLSRLRFFLYGTNKTNASAMLAGGIDLNEGLGLVTSSLVGAFDAATGAEGQSYADQNIGNNENTGTIIALRVPSDVHLGVAAFTTAYIDRATKLVYGTPLRYMDYRNNLALYGDEDTENARKRIEENIINETETDQPMRITVESHDIIGSISTSNALKTILDSVQVSVESAENIGFSLLERSVVSQFNVREPAQAVLVESMVRELFLSTVEAVLLRKMRLLRWQGLASMGYRFRQDHQDISIPEVVSIDSQKRRLEHYFEYVEKSNVITGDLAWLKDYAAQELRLLRIELSSVELDSA